MDQPAHPLSILVGMRRIVLALALVAFVGSVAADKVYRYVTPEGDVTYSDAPPAEGAKEVDLPPLQTFKPPPIQLPPLKVGAQGLEVGHPGYQAFSVASPSDDQPIRDNAGNVSVELMLSPGLRSGDTIDIMVDGQILAKGTSTVTTLTNLDRGTHTVQAAIRDGNGKVVAETDSVTFHLLRRRLGFPETDAKKEGS